MVLGFGKKKEEHKENALRPPVDYTKRYDRQKVLAEISAEGQEKLKKARVLLVGCGDRGTAAAMYLASAGVGTIGMADSKEIEITDIQRQPIFFTAEIGKMKAVILGNKLKEINPDIDVLPHSNRLRYDNAAGIISKYDVVLDCTDNYPSHYLLNDACVLAGKPLVFAMVNKFDGHASVFYAQRGPCYRCLYTSPPHPDSVAETKDTGIFGPAAGIAGLVQAAEAIKLIAGFGSPLVGRILFFSASDMYFQEAAVKKDENCAVCGRNPAVKQLIDYDEWCGTKPKPLAASAVIDKSRQTGQIPQASSAAAAPGQPAAHIHDGVPLLEQKLETPQQLEITPKEMKQKIDSGEKITVIDVREPYERDTARIDGSVFIPLGELPEKMTSLDKDHLIVVHCHHGVRSAFAAEMMRSAGFRSVYSMSGGIDEWSAQIDKNVPRYV